MTPQSPTKRSKRRNTISVGEFDSKAQVLIAEWEQVAKELELFESKHKKYLEKLENVENLKITHCQEFKKIQTKINNLKKSIDKNKSLIIIPDSSSSPRTAAEKTDLLRIRRETEVNRETPEQRQERIHIIREHLIKEQSSYLKRIEYTLPQAPERYLRIILGSELPVSILNKADQYKYKESYETF
ncbi:unnamed protein product, partial [Didymodactylos carnosus]